MNTLTKITAAFQLAFILFSCNAQVKNNLTVGEFETGISNKDSIQLLDVRTPAEYESGHIKGALLADWNNKEEFKRRIRFVDKNKPVYVYCLAGGRSAAAAKQMRAAGYEKVYELSGGINAWKGENKSLEGKSDEKQMSIEEFNQAINSGTAVLVDFGAQWCPPCRKMEPILKSLETNNAGKFKLVKVDGGKDQDILKAYNVTALPVFIVFKNGKQVWRKDGVAEEKEIAAQF
ncbi:MAG: thioredoxin fold domain-containing protein [Chitinophagaceae bacterium]|nr:thioredoxin fold domain-containing protein [Chitinophagaceae bacterium]